MSSNALGTPSPKRQRFDIGEQQSQDDEKNSEDNYQTASSNTSQSPYDEENSLFSGEQGGPHTAISTDESVNCNIFSDESSEGGHHVLTDSDGETHLTGGRIDESDSSASRHSGSCDSDSEGHDRTSASESPEGDEALPVTGVQTNRSDSASSQQSGSCDPVNSEGCNELSADASSDAETICSARRVHCDMDQQAEQMMVLSSPLQGQEGRLETRRQPGGELPSDDPVTALCENVS